MKIEELQIGDWVKGTNTEPYKLVAISYCEQVVENEYNYNIDITDLQPIPLTVEILEKNGFEKMKTVAKNHDWRWDTANTIVTAEPFGDDEWLVGANKVNTGTVRMLVSYVHQLQQVLRIFKIEKEIIL